MNLTKSWGVLGSSTASRRVRDRAGARPKSSSHEGERRRSFLAQAASSPARAASSRGPCWVSPVIPRVSPVIPGATFRISFIPQNPVSGGKGGRGDFFPPLLSLTLPLYLEQGEALIQTSSLYGAEITTYGTTISGAIPYRIKEPSPKEKCSP